ncbi:MAG: response regulator [Deltaproteobacteria bacterium]|jgi:CheY-like chemotaxis protein|nr:response regulator [Deltaproteobacteria bacterium]
MSQQGTDFVIGIADDEPEIREMIRAAVEVEFQRRFPSITIATVTFDRASAVLDYFLDDAPNAIDLLLLDVRFEQTGGGETGIDILPDLRELRPDLFVWLVSGTVDDEQVEIASRYAPMDYLQKPISRDQLVRKVFLQLSTDVVAERKAHRDALRVARQQWSQLKPTRVLQVDKEERSLLALAYPNLTFHPLALQEALDSNASEELFVTLRRIDANQLTPGNKPRVYHGVQGVSEIRCSGASRVFVLGEAGGKFRVLGVTDQHEHTSSTYVDVLRARLR